MISTFFKKRKLKQIARELAALLHSRAWQDIEQIICHSAKATDALKKEPQRVYIGVAYLMAFSIHTIDHHSRDYLDEDDRKHLVFNLMVFLMKEASSMSVRRAIDHGQRISSKELITAKISNTELISEATKKFEECEVIDIGDPKYRGDSGHTSVTWCGLMLLGVFSSPEEFPDSRLLTWEETEQPLLELYDTARCGTGIRKPKRT
jgi:hypothetical protein